MMLKAKQSPRGRTIKLARARWADGDGDQRAAAFAYYLLMTLQHLTLLLVTAGSFVVEREVAAKAVVKLVNLSRCVGVFGVCFCAEQAEVRENAGGHPEKYPE